MISIVTINYNNYKGLVSTIKSISDQKFLNKELIVIDGLSNDGSVEYLISKKKLFKKLIIEKDAGIYYAMNKGIKYASGNHLIFLNSGDTFTNKNVLNSIDFNKYENKLIFGRSISNQSSYPSKDVKNIDSFLKYKLPNHQSMFFPKNFYKNNFYDTSFKIVGDSEYKFRALDNTTYVYLDLEISNFDTNGISNNYSDFNNFRTILTESYMAAKKYKNFYYLIYKSIIHTLKFLKSKLCFWK